MDWSDVILYDIIMHESLSNIVQRKRSLAVESLKDGMYSCLKSHPSLTK